MKVLIVSFDKTLTENLKKALEGHEVYVAKNSEEALKMIPADVEGVIYDAISGAISEEDINTLYTKKFSNARYVILYDELFPVEEGNIIAPQKMLVPRETEPAEIVRKLVEFPVEAQATEQVPETEYEIEPTAFEVTEKMAEEVEEAVKEFEAPVEETVQEEVKEEAIQMPEELSPETQPVATVGTGKILIVSFDQALIDSLKAALGQKFEVVNVKTVRQAMEQGKDTDLIIFDAISGVIAEKGLIDMANDPSLANKPYVILVDDLFPINVDNIPLENKTALSRDTDVSRIKEIVEEKLATVQPQGEVVEEKAEETPVEEVVEETPTIEVEKSEEMVEEVPQEIEIERELPQEIPEIEVEEVHQPSEEAPVEVEEEAPALEALEKFMEAEEIPEIVQEKVSEPAPAPEETPTSLPAELNVEKLIEEAVSKALSEERLKEVVSKALRESLEDIRNTIRDVIKSEVEKAFENLDIRNLIRQATYQALRERLEELIT